MTSIDIAALRRHIGTRISDEDVATEAPLKAIVATFDRPEAAPGDGQPIPPGWHIGYFLSTAPTSTLAADGLPMGAGVLPAGHPHPWAGRPRPASTWVPSTGSSRCASRAESAVRRPVPLPAGRRWRRWP